MSRRENLKGLTNEELLRVYREGAEQYAQVFSNFDHVSANKGSGRVIAAFRELHARGPEALSLLLPLLEHPNQSVRATAAGHALRFAPELGEPVLVAVVEAGGLVSVNAKAVLKAWRSGTLPTI